MSSVKRRLDGKWRARYRDSAGKEHARHFPRKVDAQRWLNEVTTAVVTGAYVDPKNARTTVGEWCATWLSGYATRRASTVRQARTHVVQIEKAFGTLPLGQVRPSAVRSWCAKLKADGYGDSYVYALHARLSQIMSDAVHDGILPRNPCSRRTSPGAGKQRPYCATTDQVWALYDAFPAHLRPAVLLGAFVGLRTAEACGLGVEHVDFMRAIVNPTCQWPADPLKTETSKTAVPIPSELALELSAAVAEWGGDWIVTDGISGQASPWSIDRAMRAARKKVPGLPGEFRFHDLRHYLASLLISSGADVKVVQARMRHASAKTTLDTYGHLWPDADESTRAAVGAVLAARMDSAILADSARTTEVSE
jgi:integrase